MNVDSETRSFGGRLQFCSHASEATGGTMRFAVFLPPQAKREPLPVLWFLSGLTCTEQNFMIKAGAQRLAAERGIILVAPDTSPRDAGVDGEDDDWDFGTGAGFYVDATEEPWSTNYRMYTYVTEELPALIARHFPVRMDRQGVFGHSMGGHGALVIALRNPEIYLSVSAFAPICAPTQCPWGHKAFSGYLGPDREAWKAYDATELVRTATAWRDRTILIDQGNADSFLEEQLKPPLFRAACKEVGQSLLLRRHQGYDHSYYFIASFVEDHIAHHSEALCE